MVAVVLLRERHHSDRLPVKIDKIVTMPILKITIVMSISISVMALIFVS